MPCLLQLLEALIVEHDSLEIHRYDCGRTNNSFHICPWCCNARSAVVVVVLAIVFRAPDVRPSIPIRNTSAVVCSIHVQRRTSSLGCSELVVGARGNTFENCMFLNTSIMYHLLLAIRREHTDPRAIPLGSIRFQLICLDGSRVGATTSSGELE